MSQRNVKLVRALLPALDTDFVQLFGDDKLWAGFIETVAPLFQPDFESVNVLVGVETKYTGMDGLRAIWLDWLEPWRTYRTEVEEVIDCGDRVLLLSSDFGRRAGSTQEVKLAATFIFTVRDGKVARWEGFPDRAVALKVVGLA